MVRIDFSASAHRSSTDVLPRRGRFALHAHLAGALLLSGPAGVALAQTQFEERAPKRYFPALPDTTADLRAADFDGDGDVDALTANEYQQVRLYLNDGQGIFTDATATHVPAYPGANPLREIGLGDIDGDGDLDALLTASILSYPSLLLVNDGAGHFVDETAARVPSNARGGTRALFGDVDGDLDLDLVFPEFRAQVSLYLNDGSGFFADATAGQMPASINENQEAALADVDGDLDLDLVLANQDQDRLYLNDGAGSFTDVTATHLPVETGSFTYSLALGDFDLDLDLDLVFGSNGQDRLLVNDGQGVFSDVSSRLPPESDRADSMVVGDVEGDLDLDVVVGNNNRSRIYRNDGTGTFTEAPLPSAGSDPDRAGGLGLDDVDGDGDLDLLMGRLELDRLYLNDGLGAFTNASPERIQWPFERSSAIEIADLDLDGDLDLLTTEGVLNGGVTNGNLYFNDGRGSFPSTGILPSINPVAFAVGDVDGDADPDILLGTASICFVGYGCSSVSNQLLFNGGQGGFSAIPGRLPVDSDDTLAVALGDVDGDADLDAVLGNWQQQSRLYRNNGSGTFSDVTTGRLPSRQDPTRAVGLADFDADGDLDIVVGNEDQQDRMYVNEGLGAFFDGTATRMPQFARRTRALGVGDMDRDGDLDLVLANDGRAGLYLNNGAGKLLDYTDRMPQQVEHAWAVRLGDVDEDGDLDVVLGNRSASGSQALNRLLLNEGSATFVDQTASRLPADVDLTVALALGDLDGDRDLDLVVGNLDPIPPLAHDTNRIYLNLHRQLGARLLPLLGRTYEIELDSQPGYGTAPRIAVVAFSFGLLSTPVTSPPLVGKLYLQSPLLFLPAVSIPSPAGSRVIELTAPVDPTLVGTSFYAQAAILDGAPKMTGYLRDTFGF